jgi:hypothetical protein
MSARFKARAAVVAKQPPIAGAVRRNWREQRDQQQGEERAMQANVTPSIQYLLSRFVGFTDDQERAVVIQNIPNNLEDFKITTEKYI